MRQSNAPLAALSAVTLVAAGTSFPGPVKGAEGAPGGASATPPTASAQARVPGPPAAAAGSPWRSCSTGFSPGRDARLDVLRLSVACGPVTGLHRFGKVSGVVDEGGPPVRLRFTAARGDCFRVFAVADSPVDDLEVEIVSAKGVSVTLANQNRRWVMVGEEGPFCPAEPGDYEARFSTHAGKGTLAAAVFRGVRMRVKGSPYAQYGTAASGAPTGGSDPY